MRALPRSPLALCAFVLSGAQFSFQLFLLSLFERLHLPLRKKKPTLRPFCSDLRRRYRHFYRSRLWYFFLDLTKRRSHL